MSRAIVPIPLDSYPEFRRFLDERGILDDLFSGESGFTLGSADKDYVEFGRSYSDGDFAEMELMIPYIPDEQKTFTDFSEEIIVQLEEFGLRLERDYCLGSMSRGTAANMKLWARVVIYDGVVIKDHPAITELILRWS